jgi:NDP-sugar pyrophosphorylase family protein
MAYSVESMLGNKYKNLEIIYSKENEPLGTAGALKIAIPYMHVEYILVMNGDSFVEFDMNVLFSFHVERQAFVSIVLTKVEDVSRYGEIEVNSDGEVEHFTEKGNRAGAGWINAGVYLMKKDALCSIPDKTPLSLEKQFFPSLVKEGLYGYKTNERFIDIGTTESFHAAGEFL